MWLAAGCLTDSTDAFSSLQKILLDITVLDEVVANIACGPNTAHYLVFFLLEHSHSNLCSLIHCGYFGTTTADSSNFDIDGLVHKT